MKDVCLGIDVGSSGVRIAARGAAGEMLGFSAAPMGQKLNDPQSW